MAEAVNQQQNIEPKAPTTERQTITGAETHQAVAGAIHGESIISIGWTAYAARQVEDGKWTKEQLAHPEQNLLPAMKSFEIRQGIREGVFTDPVAVTTMFAKDLQETRVFWNDWYVTHANDRDDARELAASSIAAKEEEINPLLENPTRQAHYLTRQAEEDLIIEDTTEPAIALRKQQEATSLLEMAAKIARRKVEEITKQQQQQEEKKKAQQATEARADQVREQLAELDRQEQKVG